MVRLLKISIAFLYLLLFPAVGLQAQNFRAEASSSRIALNESFQIDFVLEGAGGNINPPPFTNFTVLSGPSTSQNYQMINGVVSQNITSSYILAPKSKGKFTIDGAIAVVNGRKIKSNSLTIEVFDAPQNSKQQQRGNQNSAPDNPSANNIGDNLFVKVSINKTNPYLGEQIVLTAKIYYRVTIADLRVTTTPKLTGFWLQDIKLPQNPQVTKETVNGKQYNVATIYKVMIFPQNQGELTIDPIELETIIRLQVKQNSRSPFDMFNDPFFGGNPFGYQDVKQKLKSNSLKVKVKSYPTKPPAEFDNITGSYIMDVTANKTTTKTNEPVTLKISVKGKGNLKLISPFTLDLPEDIETYEPKVDEKISNAGDVLSGSKTFEYLLIPRREGNYKIPPVKLCFFDPEKAKFVTLTSDELNISVAKGSTQYSAAEYPSSTNQNAVEYKGKDIIFIHLGNTSFLPAGTYFVKKPLFFILIILPFIVFIVMIQFRKKMNALMKNTELIKMRKARKIADKRLKTARNHLKSNNVSSFYSSISAALYGYISDKLSIDIAELTKDNIRSELLSKAVSEDTIIKLIETLNTCDFIRYAPTQDAVNISDFYYATVELISSIEKQIK